METFEKLIRGRMEAELSTLNIFADTSCKVEIREDLLDHSLRLILGELSEAIYKGALAEYFLVLGDYESAKNYHKQYTKELKDLL